MSADTKSMLVAVFGHYDSRGGTTALPLPAHCRRCKEVKRVNAGATFEVKRAMERYDKEIFGIEKPGDDIQSTAYGMPARQADKMVHRLFGADSPAIEDFMYVAELHYAAELAEVVESRDVDLDEGDYRVLIEWRANDREGVVDDHKQKWPKMKTEDLPSLTKFSLIDPVLLEVVKVPDGWHAENSAIRDRHDALAKAEGLWLQGSSSSWTPLQIARQKELDAAFEAEERRHQEIILVQAKLPGMTMTRWDDDAYGFVLR